MAQQAMTIGGLAKAAGVNVETIRYYQRRGLIHEPRKPAGGQRRYPESVVGDLVFVRRAQQLGFTLAEIRDLLRLSDSADSGEVRRIAEVRQSRLALQARQLGKMSAELKALVERSRRHRGEGPDPIIAALRADTVER
jgi:MerR family mercuric resistance operon transcriptional regulator